MGSPKLSLPTLMTLVSKVLKKPQKSCKSELRDLVQCCILIPRKCPCKNLFQHRSFNPNQTRGGWLCPHSAHTTSVPPEFKKNYLHLWRGNLNIHIFAYNRDKKHKKSMDHSTSEESSRSASPVDRRAVGKVEYISTFGEEKSKRNSSKDKKSKKRSKRDRSSSSSSSSDDGR